MVKLECGYVFCLVEFAALPYLQISIEDEIILAFVQGVCEYTGRLNPDELCQRLILSDEIRMPRFPAPRSNRHL